MSTKSDGVLNELSIKLAASMRETITSKAGGLGLCDFLGWNTICRPTFVHKYRQQICVNIFYDNLNVWFTFLKKQTNEFEIDKTAVKREQN